MPDIMAAPHKEWEERGTVRRYEYDTGFHRPTAIVEQPNANESERVAERFVYGNAQDVSHNLNQQVIRHYDNVNICHQYDQFDRATAGRAAPAIVVTYRRQ